MEHIRGLYIMLLNGCLQASGFRPEGRSHDLLVNQDCDRWCLNRSRVLQSPPEAYGSNEVRDMSMHWLQDATYVSGRSAVRHQLT